MLKKIQDGFPSKGTCGRGTPRGAKTLQPSTLRNGQVKDSAYDGAASLLTFAASADKCAVTPTICGHGRCISVQTGYTCRCDPGFKLSALQTNCIGEIPAALVVIKASGSPERKGIC